MTTNIGMAVCSCSWLGMIAASANCPGCGASHNSRIDKGRYDALEAVTADPRAHIEKMRRIRMVELELIRTHGKQRPSEGQRSKPTGRTITITERGVMARDSYRRMLSDALKRTYVAEATVRHANIDAP